MCRSIIKRSLSDGNILCDSNSAIVDEKVIEMDSSLRQMPLKIQGCNMGLSESTPEISTCESDISYSRYGFNNFIVNDDSTGQVKTFCMVQVNHSSGRLS